MPFDPHRDDDGAPLPTCTDMPITRTTFISRIDGLPMTFRSFVLGWTHPGWAWSSFSARHSDATCEDPT